MNSILMFSLLFLAAEALLTLVQLPLRKKKIKSRVHIVLAVVKALIAIACAALVLAGPVVLRPAQPFMMALYVALLADAAADLIYTILCALRKKSRRFAAAKVFSLVCGVLLFVYGVLNMQTVTAKSHTYTSEKLTQEYTIVFAADMHVGSAQPFETTKKTVEAMKAVRPDCIVIGGDFTDDYTTKDEMEQAFALFKNAGIPVFFIYGNHDLQGHADYAIGLQFTKAEFEKAMTENGVIPLEDEFFPIAPDLLLLGRKDITAGEDRAKAGDLVNPAPEAYLVVVDHQPTEFEENLVLGTDLQLSGHTHAGQLFPLKWLYSLIGGKVYGDYEADGAIMNVSAGACGWREPLRTEAHCNFEVVTLKPAQ